jgi:hypothetical protein
MRIRKRVRNGGKNGWRNGEFHTSGGGVGTMIRRCVLTGFDVLVGRVGRFQLITKETDPWVARTYVAIHSSSDTPTPPALPSAEQANEAHNDNYEQRTSGEKSMLVDGDGEKEKEKEKENEKQPTGTAVAGTTSRGGLSGAVEMFYADEEWEAVTAPSAASGRMRSVRR